MFVTANYFHVLGVPAAAGRLFGIGDSEEPHASPFVVLSHRFWTRRFNGDPGIIGQMVHLNGQPFTVVGVAREGFRGTSVLAPDVWVPTAMVPVVKPERGMMRPDDAHRPLVDGGSASQARCVSRASLRGNRDDRCRPLA